MRAGGAGGVAERVLAFQKLSSAIGAGLFAWLVMAGSQAGAFQLVTSEEAALPTRSVPMLELRGSPTRRPIIVVVSPAPGAGLVHSPLDLRLEFRAYGGSQIDPDSVVVTYLKDPAIDITQRITRFISTSGILITQADVPPGRHEFWVQVRDKDGRLGGGEVSFQVTK
jgi:hypothetical protein